MTDIPDTITAGDLAETLKVFCGFGHNAEVGLEYVDHGADWMEYRVAWKEELVGVPGSGRIAPSVIYSVLDSACALLPFVVSGRMIVCPTLQLRVDHYRPPTPGADIIVRGHSELLTQDISFTRAIVHEGDPDDPVAVSNGTFMSIKGFK
jgi:acyl-coenzyme A thioesterase PaaI-like protein